MRLTEAEARKLLQQWGPLIRRIVADTDWLDDEPDDRLAVAKAALIECAERAGGWVPAKYAGRIIRQRIAESVLESRGLTTEDAKSKARQVFDARWAMISERQGGRPPTDEEIAERVDVSLQFVRRAFGRAQVPIGNDADADDDDEDDPWEERIADQSTPVDEQVGRAMAVAAMREEIARLGDDQQRMVLEMTLEGKEASEIAKAIGLSPRRVNMIIAEARLVLEAALRARGFDGLG